MRVRWTTKRAMTEDRLRGLIAAYGAAPERWPEAERDAAGALLDGGAAAAEAASARALDRALDRLGAAAPTSVRHEGFGQAALTARAAATRRGLRERLWTAVGGPLPALRPAALAISAVIGLAYGLAEPPTMAGHSVIDRIPVAAVSGDAETLAVDVLGSAE